MTATETDQGTSRQDVQAYITWALYGPPRLMEGPGYDLAPQDVTLDEVTRLFGLDDTAWAGITTPQARAWAWNLAAHLAA